MDARSFLAWGVTGVAVVLIAGIAWAGLLVSELRGVRADNEALAAEVEDLARRVDLDDFEAQAALLELKLDTITTLRHNPVPTWLVALEAAVPAGAWLTSLEFVDRRMTLQGASADPLGAAALMEALQHSECFQDVALRSVEATAEGQEFWLTAATTDVDCAGGTPGGRSLFLSPGLEDALRPQATVHPLLRWEPRDYDLVGMEIGLATLRDPQDGLHRVMVGSSVGSGGAVVKFITDDSLVLTEDEVVDRDTGRTRTHITTLTLVE